MSVSSCQRCEVTKWVVIVVAMLVLPGAAAGQERSPDVQKRRDQIQIMEGVLAQAVVLGAEEVSRKLQQLEPGVTWLAGQVRARGFVLEGYGVFFDVEIPVLRQSLLFAKLTLDRDTKGALEAVRRVLESLPEGPARQQAQQAFRRVELQLAPMNAGLHAAPSPSSPPPPGVVTSASAEAPVVAPAAAAAAPVLEDPLAEYERAVTRRLIDAMLDYSLNMNLGSEEWLTVAARDSGPTRFGDPYDVVTIVLRVKGSDLAIYAADRSRRDEVRGRVNVSVF